MYLAVCPHKTISKPEKVIPRDKKIPFYQSQQYTVIQFRVQMVVINQSYRKILSQKQGFDD